MARKSDQPNVVSSGIDREVDRSDEREAELSADNAVDRNSERTERDASDSESGTRGTETRDFADESVRVPELDAGTSEVKRRRGRPPGSGKKKEGPERSAAKEKAKVSIKGDQFATYIYGAHEMFAAFTRTPELLLSEKEATALSERIVALSEYYDIPVLTGKLGAIVALGFTAIGIYGPRVPAIAARRSKAIAEKRAARQAAADSNFSDPLAEASAVKAQTTGTMVFI